MVITKRDVDIVLHPELQRQADKLEFLRMMEDHGPDTILTWWRNCTAIMHGHTLPSPGTRSDPRR